MAALGYYTGPIDGIAGPRTIAAIKAAQKKYQLEVTGKSDDKLRSLLEAELKQRKEGGERKRNYWLTEMVVVGADFNFVGWADNHHSQMNCGLHYL